MFRGARLLMVCGRLLAGPFATPSSVLSGGVLIQSSRFPDLVQEALKSVTGRLQVRIPGTYAPRRSKLALHSHLVALGAMQPAAKRPRAEGGGTAQQQQPQPQKQGGRKKKPVTPEIEARVAIQMAARERDVVKALSVYDSAKEEGIKLSLDSYASILYLCSGGDDWESALQQGPGCDPDIAVAVGSVLAAPDAGASVAPVSTETVSSADAAPLRDNVQAAKQPIGVNRESMARGRRLLKDMQQAGIKPNEICFTALARMAALSGSPHEALARAQDVVAQGLPPRLRCFAPALAGYAESGQAAKAFEVDAAISEAGLEAGEAEFARLLQAAAAGGVSWQQAEGVLNRIGRELTVLQPGMLVRLRQFFNSAAAHAAFADDSSSSMGGASSNGGRERRWKLEECTVSSSGDCGASCGGTLAALDLNAEEYAEFQAGIAALARRQERQPNDLVQFLEWLEANGPFGSVVDAANVAFFGQNFDAGGFTFAQIRAVVGHLRTAHPDLRPLVILHVNRTKAHPAQREEAAALLEELQKEGCFYATPLGSNDDWYWIYAAVAAGPQGLLVSNDEMRDHLFQMLAPRYFSKWKQRHQVRYKFGAGGVLTFDYPPPYTTCAQRLANGAWVFPGTSGTWLCAVPVEEAAAMPVEEVVAAI